MASKFTAGMKNFVEVLNQMWDAFAAGPYNALPLTGGTLTGPVASTSRISTTADMVAKNGILMGNPGEQGISSFGSPAFGGGTGVYQEVLSMGVAGVAGAAFPGRFTWSTASGIGTLYSGGYALNLRAYDAGTNALGASLFSVSGTGLVRIPLLKCNSLDNEGFHVISPLEQVQGRVVVTLAAAGTFYVAAGASGSAADCVLNLARNTNSGRSINAGGTINASGADYAEYLIKALPCGTIAPGQIVGIDADGRLTDKWNCAIAFMVKSTNPCMVGGDSWAQDLGARPAASQRGEDDTEDTWAAKELEHASALAAFDIALEQRRQTVDRIAFAGQVPVNVHGATPGQYIVPVQEGEGIAGQAVDRGDMTLDQYMSAIGRVIAIEDDGRARIIVKVA